MSNPIEKEMEALRAKHHEELKEYLTKKHTKAGLHKLATRHVKEMTDLILSIKV